MSTGKLILYAVAGLLALLAVAFVVQTVLAVISIALTVLRLLAILAVLGGVGYVGYRVYRFVSGLTSDSSSAESRSTAGDRSTDTAGGDTLRQQYLNGEISEEEFERRLERELDSSEFDSIDRELQRERI